MAAKLIAARINRRTERHNLQNKTSHAEKSSYINAVYTCISAKISLFRELKDDITGLLVKIRTMTLSGKKQIGFTF